ncbi:riboflavin synthase [Candidatus Photodesmus anomalopis]|uniref:Riboflavin synthase n=1 Tax=Candidatus Photodesmus katoptron Akat1 TaxID=1236703 RepID=S3EGX2_9GAMM|nr:riboflavin synthase [Candidatus Photodesmus katoptron]EPE37413.1 riboflavin synthase, alpha subunit [Candidatus Photodesmus katoptron Akat1]
MFTGIVQGMAKLVSVEKKKNFRTHTIELLGMMNDGLMVGNSVAHNGCCLTVTHIDGNLVSFDIIETTLRLTNLGELTEGMLVNIERAVKFGDEIGGHCISGHISLTSKIDKLIETENNLTICFTVPLYSVPYVLEKGYIALDGCSLTIGKIEGQCISVHLIPETLKRTLFGKRKVGDRINVEFDSQTQAIVNTVKQLFIEKNSFFKTG